ncbi:MAG TPA: 2-C-methyl-D-erythritol 2,4-cyclodiphosphate synthase [Syntrophales bacterium]|nr:2-C-methyl-D-erythritol 2,4-cyclodiphosphate synthase [Syntrophales bacterium]HOX95598.1 2-C-methyl-D-erythritol 2,4-cyclodiphosphate synthase [Syntrophales bacterium]HPI57197.1 2-C-methyl-D-erythritol 2,4-cyclodiphosphate synthase [Syntrophales bacterium]HPN23419.1 2-C-methyl-D-erythritol 2,4-cyclodiphosphate synthase [Syntrophales bacterium]HQM28056.1 2-C-methyl-D-erythritol 2,4-cyclodiphosphate synthase [Syntrophales bacterium]
MKVGFGYDSHRLVEGRRLVIGGVEIPFEQGLLGHSDADVLLHAVADALLGAIGEGDLGRHFPDTDPACKDMSSLLILQKVNDMAERKGLVIGNLDSTVVLERPRLAEFIPLMVARIASALGVDQGRVNVKAKTNEKMGFTGRGEGIAAFAVVTVKEKKA